MTKEPFIIVTDKSYKTKIAIKIPVIDCVEEEDGYSRIKYSTHSNSDSYSVKETFDEVMNLIKKTSVRKKK